MSEENKEAVETKENTKQEVTINKFTGTPVAPKIFMDLDEKISVDVDVVSDATNGRVEFVIMKDNVPKDESGYFVFTPLHFEFSFPTYDQISGYRQRSTNFSSGKIDENVFRSFLLINHLKSWNMKDGNGEDVPLDFEVGGELSKETLVVINRVPTIVWDIVLTIFQKEAKISGYSQD